MNKERRPRNLTEPQHIFRESAVIAAEDLLFLDYLSRRLAYADAYTDWIIRGDDARDLMNRLDGILSEMRHEERRHRNNDQENP